MLGLPVHPRLARMLVAEPSPLWCVARRAVDERDILRGRPDDLPADLALRAPVLSGRTRHHDLADRGAFDGSATVPPTSPDAPRIRFDTDLDRRRPRRSGACCTPFPDRLAARRRPGQFQLRTGSGAWLPDTDPLAHESFVVAADLDGKRDRARIRLAAALDADDVAPTFADEIDERSTLEWDDDRDDLVETRRATTRIDAARVDDETAVARRRDHRCADATGVPTHGLAVLGWSKASIDLRQRVEFLHRTVGDPWPDWSVEHLVETLDDWLAPYLPGATGRRDLDQVDLAMVLRSQLPWPEGADLDRLAPGRTRPARPGRSVPIDYSGDEPTASVRVQDLFGTTVHPTAGGRPDRAAPALAGRSPDPDHERPARVLGGHRGPRSARTWPGRYPKHQWPDDPATADPEAPEGPLTCSRPRSSGCRRGWPRLAVAIVFVGSATQASIGIGLGLDRRADRSR